MGGKQQPEPVEADTNHNANNVSDIQILVDDETEEPSNGMPTVAPIEILLDESGDNLFSN